MRWMMVIMLAALSGCARVPARPEPITAQCDAICYRQDSADKPCESRARWEADPQSPQAFDALVYEVIPALRAETWQCGVRLKACQQCLQRLKAAGVIQ